MSIDNHHYESKMKELCDRLYEGIEQANKVHGTQHGFIGLMIRDPTFGNIDIMHNMLEVKDLINILELTLQQLKKE